MNPKEIISYLGKDWTALQNHMSSALKSDIALLNMVNDGILSNSGKQLRPMLALLIARACNRGEITGDTLHFAAASELLHNATLLHDDVADDSDERRGKPTLKSVMGPSVSVLVGDFWLVKAMESILNSPSGGMNAMRLFSRTFSDLAEGEMLQLQKASSCDTDENDYLRIIFYKTASLFEVSAVSAAISVAAPEEYVAAVREYAVSLGLSFQIMDDIFDYTPGLDVGKPLGVDILEQKITMPLLGAFRNADEAQEKEIRELVKAIPEHPEGRDRIVEFVREHNGLEEARQVLEEYSAKAVRAVSILPDSREKQYLVELAAYVGARNR